MKAAWPAGGIRTRALLSRRLGAAGARDLAMCPSLADALQVLAASPYRHDVRPGQTLADAEHAVGATLLWHLRVLAGWQPREGATTIRMLAGWFELANVTGHARALAGHGAAEPYHLGALTTAWSRLAAATSPADLRAALTASLWGDPGADTPQAIAVGMSLAWASRIAAAVPDATAWAAGGAALIVARERFLAGHSLAEPAARRAASILGSAALAAPSFADFVRRLPSAARWALAGTEEATTLWQAETRWWARVEHDGFGLLRRTGFGPSTVVGGVAVLAVDAWRVRAALEIAARGGRPVEAFDALA